MDHMLLLCGEHPQSNTWVTVGTDTPEGRQKTKYPLVYPTSHALYASTLITPPVDEKRTHVFEGISSKTQAHGSSKQSDQTMAQPEVAPNVTTGITQVMPHKKWWGHWWCIL